MDTVSPISTSVEKTNIWIKELSEELGWRDRHKVFEALKVTLKTVRDRMTPDECAHFAAQLPMVIRGAFYESWKPSAAPQRWRTREELLKPLQEGFSTLSEPNTEPETVVRAVMKVVAAHVTSGEVEDVKGMMPEDARALFPETSARA